MNTLTRVFRLMHINFVLLKHGLDEIILTTPLFRPLYFLIYLSPYKWLRLHKKTRGARIREALEELGPIFVKFGQLLSTRIDLLPEDIIQELVLLQDRVAPFPSVIAKQTIEAAFKQPIQSLFQTFDEVALASASIAQVHAATLLNGESVVVKILRPYIHKIIARDLELLKTLANLAHRYWKGARQFKPREVILEIQKGILSELDLPREGSNASVLRRHFNASDLLYVPKICWSLTKSNILVMERIQGIPIYNVEFLKQSGFDLTEIAKRCIEIFFTQAFRDSFFHADMHPGNLFVGTQSIENPLIIAVDFGIMGVLEPHDQLYLAENFMAFFKRDYRRVAELHLESHWIPYHTRLDEFESAIRAVCEPIFERPIKEVSFADLLLRLLQTAKNYQVNIQPQLMLLQKTLFNVEGLARQLDPNLDLWTVSEPFLNKWMKNQVGLPSLFKKIKKYAPYWFANAPELPNLVYNALKNISPSQYDIHDPYSKTHIKLKTSLKDMMLGILLGIILAGVFFFIRRP